MLPQVGLKKQSVNSFNHLFRNKMFGLKRVFGLDTLLTYHLLCSCLTKIFRELLKGDGNLIVTDWKRGRNWVLRWPGIRGCYFQTY